MNAPRTYTAEQKREAILLGLTNGPAQTSRALNIPKGTLSCWLYKARQGRPGFAIETPEVNELQEPAELSDTSTIVNAPDTASSIPEEPAASPSTASSPHIARVYTPSERARALQCVEELGVTATAKKLGISRFSLYTWRRKEQLAAEGKGTSPTEGPDPADIEAQRDQEILNIWSLHPGLGPSQVRNQLRRKGVRVGVNTVRRVMEEAGYRPPKVKRTPHNQRYEAVRPNHLWHLDFVQRYINRTSTFTLILIDDHSRFVVGHGVDSAERADMVVQTFSEAVQRYGRPEAVMNDKGSAFWSWKGTSRFTALLTELGIDQVIAEHKEWNGKVESFNGYIAKELFNVQRFHDLSEMKHALAAHLHWYNHRRTHHALGGLLVPADRYYGRVEEVLAHIEGGTGPSSHTKMLALQDRTLELFKVISRGGTPEIWLMGQQLLGHVPQ